MKRLRQQQGLTLIEVLIALLVLSIGMVGLGALLLTTLSNVQSSSHYSLASALALDLEERLWFEVASISATNPDSLNDGCLTNTQIQEVRRQMVIEWSEASKESELAWQWTKSQRMRLPGLTVRLANLDTQASSQNGDISWRTMTMIIGWDEARFDDVADEREEFAGNITVVCRPNF